VGQDDNVVYVKTIGSSSAPVSATLSRYDVATSKTTQILQLANAAINDPQVSSDGQWVIFTSQVDGSPAIEMVRMDGQGVQTLYCMPPTPYAYEQTILNLLLSPDQKQLAFVASADLASGFSLLNLAAGTVQLSVPCQRGTGTAVNSCREGLRGRVAPGKSMRDRRRMAPCVGEPFSLVILNGDESSLWLYRKRGWSIQGRHSLKREDHAYVVQERLV
jgi:hypothetical protein